MADLDTKGITISRGLQSLTPHDLAEIIIFALERPRHVVLADVLVLPRQQVMCLDLAEFPSLT